MSEIFHIRAEKRGGFGIYRNEVLIIFNLTNVDVQDFCQELKKSAAMTVDTSEAGFVAASEICRSKSVAKRSRHRPLILAPHIELMRDMMARNPKTTARDVERVLRDLGVKFAARSAVTNVARHYNLELAA